MVFSFSDWVNSLLKGVGHKYIKRIPYTTPKGRRYRYVYRVTNTHQGRHAFDEEHLTTGAKFALNTEDGAEFHGHITAVDGDKITYTIDDGPKKGEEVTTTRAELVAELHDLHDVQDKLSAARDKVRERIAEAKRAGHEGVVRRLETRLAALGGDEETAKQEQAEPREGTQGADNFETMPDEPRPLKTARRELADQEETLEEFRQTGADKDTLAKRERKISEKRAEVEVLEESHLSRVFSDRLRTSAESAEGKQLIDALAEAHEKQEDAEGAERALVDFYKETALKRKGSQERLKEREFKDSRNIQDRWQESDENILVDRLKEQATEALRIYLEHGSAVSAGEDSPYTQAQVDAAVRRQFESGARAEALEFAYTEGMLRTARELRAQDETAERVTQGADNFETMPEVEADAPTQADEAAQDTERAQRRAQREERESRAATDRGPAFVNDQDFISHEDARDEYISALVPNAQSLKESAKELRGESASAIIAAAKAPLVAGEKTVYTLPGGLGVAAELDEASRVLTYQIQFSDGKVSDLERVTFDEPPSAAKLKTLARGLVGSVYGGSDGDGDARYYTLTNESDLRLNAQRLARFKKLEDRERDFDTFSKMTEEPRVQRDQLDAITPREDALESASDIDRKTAATLKKVIDPKQTIRNLDEAFRVGDALIATDGHRIFVRRGMSYGKDGEQVSTGAGSIGGVRVSLAGIIPNFISGAEQQQTHVGTMSKETAAHVVAALKVGGAKIKATGRETSPAGRVTLRADGRDVTIKFNGRDVAKFPQSSDGAQGDYRISARYLSDALSGGGAVSLHLPPVKFAPGGGRQYSPLRFDSMLGSMHVQPLNMDD